jgi:glucose-6-phosphate isomerase
VGLPLVLKLGMPHFQALLSGAYAMDQHFCHQPFLQNIPVLLALLGVWQINFFNRQTLAIMPYEDGLQYLPAYLQQLEMESNGKSVDREGVPLTYATAPVIWGGVGCNGQHAFMQLLHQGTQIIPVDFWVGTEANSEFAAQHQLLMASCLSQSQALMEGCYLDLTPHKKNPLAKYKQCMGNRPSTTLFYPKLTPEVLGTLIALYEHKVFVQGVLWNINSFDQWGVELAKGLTREKLNQQKS